MVSERQDKSATIISLTGDILNYEDMPAGTIFHVGSLWRYKGHLVRISPHPCRQCDGGAMVFEDELEMHFCKLCGPLEPELCL